MTDDMIPEYQLGLARQGGYRAALSLANIQTVRDAFSAWIVADRGSGLIRNLTGPQLVDEFGDDLAALNGGKAVTAEQFMKGDLWRKVVKLPRSEPLVQVYGTDEFRGVDLGRVFIAHKGKPDPASPAAPVARASALILASP